MPQPTPLHITPEIHVHLGGDLHVHPAGAPTETVGRASIIREYLEMVDPTALEAEALASIDTSGSVVSSILRVLHTHAEDT